MTYDPDAPPQAKPSQAPSWVILGFVLGALCVFAFPRTERPVPTAPVPPAAEIEHATIRAQPISRFQAVEAVFTEWATYASWDADTTEISVYDPDLKKYAECYEVLRHGDDLYFRSIPSLTRPILTHGIPNNSPIEFTESAASRAQWLKDVNDENWRSFSNGVREGMGPTVTPAPAAPRPSLPPEAVPSK